LRSWPGWRGRGREADELNWKPKEKKMENCDAMCSLKLRNRPETHLNHVVKEEATAHSCGELAAITQLRWGSCWNQRPARPTTRHEAQEAATNTSHQQHYLSQNGQ
jgi:hypothetical protein